MIEKMARAICVADGKDPDQEQMTKLGLMPRWTLYKTHARAALTAMLEPSPIVIDKGIDALDDCVDSDFSSNADGERDYYTTIRSDAAAVTFVAMIQAALDEKEG